MESRQDEKTARKKEVDMLSWTPPQKYAEAGKYLYNHIKFSEELLDIETGKLKLPANINSIKIDVGLSYTAPNSALWIKNNPSVFVFGFEPNSEAVDYLLYGKMHQKSARVSTAASIRKVGGLDIKKYLGKNFMLFDVAIDNCEPGMKKFYMTKGVGTSSFHRPTNEVMNKQPEHFSINEYMSVQTVRLSDFMSLLPWDRFEYVEHIKVDTQGNDVRVLESAGDYLKKTVFITAEVATDVQYEFSHTEQELDNLMAKYNFEFLPNTNRRGNKTYVNRNFKHLLGKHENKLDYMTVEL